MRIRRNRPDTTLITFSVGKPPSRRVPRKPRPVSIWPTTLLGALLAGAIIAAWMGSHRAPGGGNPASTTSTISRTATP
jgi:hypothetical protein